jgi:predicted nucleic acid-binding protein
MSEAVSQSSPPPPGYVVDASVGIKLFIDDRLSGYAHQLFGQLNADPPSELYVPDLFYIECDNVLWKYIRWAGLEQDVALADLENLSQLDLQVTSTADLMTDALQIAAHYSITAYDACYIALANRLDLPLVTADVKMVGLTPSTYWLGDLKIS